MKLDLENKLILEFANIGPKTHKFNVDIIFHVMQPGDKKLKHGARAKFMKRNTNDEFCITISDAPTVIGNWQELVSKKRIEYIDTEYYKIQSSIIKFLE